MARQALTVPSRAVQFGREESYVYLVGKDDRAVYRKVKVLFEHQGVSVVEGELAEGDRVVVDGQVAGAGSGGAGLNNIRADFIRRPHQLPEPGRAPRRCSHRPRPCKRPPPVLPAG